MARIIKQIEIEGKKATAIFNTGASYSYVRKGLLDTPTIARIKKPITVRIGGRRIKINEFCWINGEIQGLDFSTWAVPVKKIGIAREIKKEIDVIIGALTMEQWAIIPYPKTGKLDLEGLRNREITEFFGSDTCGIQSYSCTDS